MTMAEWEQKLDAFLSFNEKDLLDHAGKISAQVAEKLVLERYKEFEQKRRQEERQIADTEDISLLEVLSDNSHQEAFRQILKENDALMKKLSQQ